MRLAYKLAVKPAAHVRGIQRPPAQLCHQAWDNVFMRIYSNSSVLTQVQNNVRTTGFWAANANTLALPAALKGRVWHAIC